jgi:hypothetical protein
MIVRREQVEAVGRVRRIAVASLFYRAVAVRLIVRGELPPQKLWGSNGLIGF